MVFHNDEGFATLRHHITYALVLVQDCCKEWEQIMSSSMPAPFVIVKMFQQVLIRSNVDEPCVWGLRLG